SKNTVSTEKYSSSNNKPSFSISTKCMVYAGVVPLICKLVSTYCLIPFGPYIVTSSLSPPKKERLLNKPGSPKIWSPCKWVMKILLIFRGFKVVCNIWCWVASPQSNIHSSLISCNKFNMIAVTFRSFEGSPAPVPKNVISIIKTPIKNKLILILYITYTMHAIVICCKLFNGLCYYAIIEDSIFLFGG